MSQHLGVIGLGSLGANMARLLAEDGYAVHAFDLDSARTAAAAEQAGVTGHNSARAVAEKCDLVLLSLPQSEAVAAACLEPGGLVEGARRGLLVVDTTSGYPERTKEIAARLAEAGVRYVDAAITIRVGCGPAAKHLAAEEEKTKDGDRVRDVEGRVAVGVPAKERSDAAGSLSGGGPRSRCCQRAGM